MLSLVFTDHHGGCDLVEVNKTTENHVSGSRYPDQVNIKGGQE